MSFVFSVLQEKLCTILIVHLHSGALSGKGPCLNNETRTQSMKESLILELRKTP